MKCDWYQDGVQQPTGWPLYRCRKCPAVAVSPYPPETIRCACGRWPRWDEWGEWLTLVLAAVYLTPQRYAWLRWRLGLDEVPEEGCGGCEARKAWLNTWGGRVASSTHWLSRLLAWLFVSRAPPAD